MLLLTGLFGVRAALAKAIRDAEASSPFLPSIKTDCDGS
jgi:hypothetical protein